jgi:ribosomal protein L32
MKSTKLIKIKIANSEFAICPYCGSLKRLGDVCQNCGKINTKEDK